MYTNSDQTAKLIELGFEKPKTIVDKYYDFDAEDYKEVNHYSTGELVELLPRRIYRDYNYYKPSIFSTSQGWHVVYADFGDGFMWIIKHDTYSTELIDAIFEMLIELKEEGVI
jgi:hypothetical protein